MSAVVCFQCGLDVGHPPTLNQLEDGSNCPRCAQRVLEAQPAIFHAPFELVQGGEIEQSEPTMVAGDESSPPEPA